MKHHNICPGFTFAVALGIAAPALAQQAVQWRVEDGGNGHWYQRVTDGMGPYEGSWHFHRSRAESRGGQLASITSEPEEQFVASLSTGQWLWIGGFQAPTAAEPSGDWRWLDGELFTYARWTTGQPDDAAPGQDHLRWRPWARDDIGEDPAAFEVQGALVEWSADCNGDGTVDYGQILQGQLIDVDENGIADICELGVIAAWGHPGTGEVPTGTPEVLRASAGENFTVFIREDGTIGGWGANEWGQVSPPPGFGVVRSLAAGYAHTLALTTTGTVKAWGANTYGQCNVPPGLISVSQVAAAADHSFALGHDGVIRSWGTAPVPPATIGRVRHINAGWGVGVAIRLDGTLVTWGGNLHGQQSVPPGLGPTRDADASYGHVAALREDGTVASWGLNNAGQCNVPADLGPAIAVTTGSFHTLVLLADGTVRAWGAGVPGTGGWPNFNQSAVPPDALPATMIAAGGYHSIAVVRALDPCPGDVTDNGVVDGVDLSLILALWGTSGQKFPRSDANDDGIVDANDLAIVLSGWGPCPN